MRLALGTHLVGLTVLALFPSLAQAQQVDLNQFRPSETARDGFAVSTASDQGHLHFGAQLYLDYGNDALAFEDGSGGVAQVVQHQMTAHALLSLGLWSRVVVYAGIPSHIVLKGSGDLSLINVPRADGGGLGDIWIGTRVRLMGTEQKTFQLALQGTLNIGTASLIDGSQQYRGMSDHGARIGGHPELITTFNALDGRLRFSLNLGYNIRPNVSLDLIQLGDELTYAFGGMYDFFRKRNSLVLLAEVVGRTGLSASTGSSKFGAKGESPLEVLTGLKYHHHKGLTGGLGGGFGITSSYGAPDFRIFAMVGFTTRNSDKHSEAASEQEAPEPVQAIAAEPAPAAVPGKPSQSVSSGSPSAISAITEPASTPTANEFALASDRDKDGLPDNLDNCPKQKGNARNHGCKKPQLVQLSENGIEAIKKIEFAGNTGRIVARSLPVLKNVALVMNAHPEFARFRIEVHTDTRGADNRNLKISQLRAEEIMRFLRKQHVSKARLRAKGMGESAPILPEPKTAADHQANARVEFIIVRN